MILEERKQRGRLWKPWAQRSHNFDGTKFTSIEISRKLLGRSTGEGIGYPLQSSWAPLVAQLVKNLPVMQETWVWSLGWEDPLEKGKATHSSTLAWKIPWMEELGGLQSMGSLRVRHDLATSPSLFTFMHWRLKWQPTPVFLPGESQRRGRLVGYRLWGHTESDTTEVT